MSETRKTQHADPVATTPAYPTVLGDRDQALAEVIDTALLLRKNPPATDGHVHDFECVVCGARVRYLGELVSLSKAQLSLLRVIHANGYPTEYGVEGNAPEYAEMASIWAAIGRVLGDV